MAASTFGAACDDGDVEVTTRPPATPAVDRMVAEVCGAVFRCCDRGEASFVLGPYVSEEDCQARLLQRSTITAASLEIAAFAGPAIRLPNLAGLERAVTEGRIVVDEAALDACVAHLAALPCASPTPATDDDPTSPLCADATPPPGESPCDVLDLFVGAVPEGGACTSGLLSLECAAGLGCAADAATGVEGECVPVGDVDDPCFTDAECGVHLREGELPPGLPRREALYCSQADGTCQLLRRQGETCRYARDDAPTEDTALVRCAPGLSCDPVTDLCVPPCSRGAPCADDTACDEEAGHLCIAGRCDLPRELGSPCEEEADCEDGLTCAVTAAAPGGPACTERLADGDACFASAECASSWCDALRAQCAPQVEAGEPCPSGDSAQCSMGRCTPDFTGCTADGDCPLSGSCDEAVGQCSPYCVELKPDGAICVDASECASSQCIAGSCRTPPLEDGVDCDDDLQCDSGFCSPGAERVCTGLPLDLGDPCTASEQCSSEVCMQEPGSPTARCITGLQQGESCGAAGQPPCSPLTLYCDTEQPAPLCVPLRGTGEDCEGDVQCRGACLLKWNRTMCFPPDDPEEPLCGGGGAPVDPSTDEEG